LTGGGCPACADNRLYRFVHREILLLLVLGAIAGALFLLTRAAAAANRGMRVREAAVWFDLGQRQLQTRRLEEAVTSLRRATTIDRKNRGYRLRLAEALAASGQDGAARQVLLELRGRAPEDPEINTTLARLEVRRQDLTNAIRYYENALYGSWPLDQAAARRHLRAELIRYLLAHGEQRRALSQLLVLSANLPEEVPLKVETAQLFMSAGDSRRALEHFRQALSADRGNAVALAGAGEAAFNVGDYSRARRYLRAVPRQTERIRELSTLADLVLSSDPLMPGLRWEERRRRLLAGLRHATTRLERCLLQPGQDGESSRRVMNSLQQEAFSLTGALTGRRFRGAPEVLERGVDLLSRVERAADDAGCGTPTNFDRALSLVARRYGSDEP
jgi:tetratricopeptide (TPR) repeat protein